ncbi:MAG: bifunctional proline dehydrogenase/L-glutamate gamma-semialdehyde dehydrogenase [Chlamydiae bacterium]|nr:bifunctional proline dehydrogenase/L-glutamate gamma-semialdehyde dehydrogenase [Chlamydiota bacterium]
MSEKKKVSKKILKAKELLYKVHGTSLSNAEREKKSIELASFLLDEALHQQTFKEKLKVAELARMMDDPKGKAFTTYMTDQCFRSKKSSRISDQLIYLLHKMGTPKYLGPIKKSQLILFKFLGKPFSFLLVPLATYMLRRATSSVILPGEMGKLSEHMHKRRAQGVRLNLNHLGEAILGEEEARRRLHVYLHDLKQDDIEYVSIKISTIFSQIHIVDWDKTLKILSERLRELYRVAMKHTFKAQDGTERGKFVNLDMEEYRDLHLTKDLFKKVLDEEEFLSFSAGIVLQAYLPDSFEIFKEIIEWAKKRVSRGGAPVKVRIVKGANLAMEQVEASLKKWPQAPFKTKREVDANYKRMVHFGSTPENARAVHLGIASHNLFDISYAMLLRAENKLEKEVSFEMLEGMADHMRRAVQELVGDILLYCPVATKEDFQSAIAYLIRRLDENTGAENFLRHSFGLKPGTEEWMDQIDLFTNSCRQKDHISSAPRRNQNRHDQPSHLEMEELFENEADTDFSLFQNQKWAAGIVKKWQKKPFDPIPLVIGGKEIHQENPEGIGVDPSHPKKDPLYHFSLASAEQIDEALEIAKSEELDWAKTPSIERCKLISDVAKMMRKERGDLIGVMMRDGGKTVLEAEPEVSEAIDFAEYYLRSMKKMHGCEDIEWHPKGTILVTPPWNFPISIPAGCICAALVTGNCVIFKPAPEAVVSGWILANLFWKAGISKKVLQFVNCEDEPIGSKLIADPRVNGVILTGATSTARLFLKLRPSLDLTAETGGKNAMIITAMADRDLAIKDLINSAFGHSGQKCSAASLAILEAEVYDDPHFRRQLKDAVESLKVGSPFDLSAKIVPLIREPGEALLRGLTRLDRKEEWLVKPKQDSDNPQLWTPGVKFGVKERSFMHQTELFGPVLGVMRAKNLDHAIYLANGTPYGLTSGIHTLDEREQKKWMEEIEAGNLYVNRGITGAVVRRQPFGGCKASGFGRGAKAGGPNYLWQFMTPVQAGLPQEKIPISNPVNQLTNSIEKIPLSGEQLGLWYASISNYAYWAKKFARDADPSKILGQDNLFRYRPRKNILFRIQQSDAKLDVLRVFAAALSCSIKMEISWDEENNADLQSCDWKSLIPDFEFHIENEDRFITRLKTTKIERVRLLSTPSKKVQETSAEKAIFLDHAPVLANGRFELLHYLREIAISIDYHRYGNLGLREVEQRAEIL